MLIQKEHIATVYHSISDFWLFEMNHIEHVNALKKWDLLSPENTKKLEEEGILALLSENEISDYDVMEWTLQQRDKIYDFTINTADDLFYITEIKLKK